jgi:hypothetical protein
VGVPEMKALGEALVRLTSHVWNAFVHQTPPSAHDHPTQVSKNLELSSSLDFFFLKAQN